MILIKEKAKKDLYKTGMHKNIKTGCLKNTR